MKPYWFGTISLVAVLLLVGLGYADQTRLYWVAEDSPTASQPLNENLARGRVVGVLAHCDLRQSGDVTNLSGTECSEIKGQLATARTQAAAAHATPPSVSILNHRIEVSVLTDHGTPCTVWVPAETLVSIGAIWPPK